MTIGEVLGGVLWGRVVGGFTSICLGSHPPLIINKYIMNGTRKGTLNRDLVTLDGEKIVLRPPNLYLNLKKAT